HPGEHPLAGAVREVREETGESAAPGRGLGTLRYRYQDRASKAGDKVVHYWAMQALGGEFRAGEEVDAITWLAPDVALARLTYARDREPLERLLDAPQATTPLLLIRHARAGDRASWKGDDRLRPLDQVGLAQATALADVLGYFGPVQVYAADRLRCVQTAAPLAARWGVPVHTDPALSEESQASHPGRALRRLQSLAEQGPTAACSQGGLIPWLVDSLASRDHLPLPPARARKASVWVLSFAAHHLVGADYLADLATGAVQHGPVPGPPR
ncbi:MAG: NUDIX hydrolase, partial [Mycobacteriales bacterium]